MTVVIGLLIGLCVVLAASNAACVWFGLAYIERVENRHREDTHRLLLSATSAAGVVYSPPLTREVPPPPAREFSEDGLESWPMTEDPVGS